MTQFQFEVICKVIESGAPALADELCGALNDLVIDRNNLAKENGDLKEELAKLNSSTEEGKPENSNKSN